jgi:hypothetical protein
MTTAIPKTSDKVVILEKEVVDNLVKNVTCSQCKKVPRKATISWCTAHHLMCQSCYDSLASTTEQHVQCGPDCQIGVKPALSPLVANVLEELPTKCRFTHNGCQFIIIFKYLIFHEFDCVYRNIRCPFHNCNFYDMNVSFIGLGEHLEANHKDLRMIGQAKSKDIIPLSVPEPDKWIPQELTFHNRSFFTEVFEWKSNDDANKHLQGRLRKAFCIFFYGTRVELLLITPINSRSLEEMATSSLTRAKLFPWKSQSSISTNS